MNTIAAISTANAVSGIGVIRLSGDEAISCADTLFRAANGAPLSAAAPRMMTYGKLLDRNGAVLDNILAVVFPAPHSYTGENCVEFHCHGSPVVLSECLSALFACGVRQATAGEFTKRAFLNGRMDLTQAEAVIDLIDSETAEAARNAACQLGGAIFAPISKVYDALMDITARFYAIIDYPDEDIEPLQRADMEQALVEGEQTLSRLLATSERGKIIKYGVPAAIIGRPNVGKSSLLNALLGFDRAIVTDIAGTTRDTIEEKVLCGGILLRLSDTAGLRSTEDTVEKIGVDRAKIAAENASLAFLVLDGSVPLTDEDIAAIASAKKAQRAIAVINKSDLPQAIDEAEIAAQFPCVCKISAKEGNGLSALEEAVAALFPDHSAAPGETLTNDRQCDAVSRALVCIRAAKESLLTDMTPDVILSDAEEAMSALGELTGKSIREDLVATIFSRFCVGK